MKRDTVGKISQELSQKAPDSRNPIEIERELHKDYEASVLECLERGRKEFLGDFFIVVITKKEPLMQNVLRHYYLPRNTCPTPDYDQAVYKFTREGEILDFIWVVPSRETCFMLRENQARVAPAEYGLLQFVLRFSDGSLYKLAKKLNGEAGDHSLLAT